MNKKLVGWVIALAVLAVIATFIVRRSSHPGADTELEPIRIGVILNLTGGLAQADTPKKTVLETALEYLKQHAPSDDAIQAVELVVEDGRTDPKAGIAAYQKLYNDGIRIFITGSSFNAMSLFPLTEEAGCLLFGISGHPDFGKGGSYSFRTYPRVETGVSYMQRALRDMGNPKIYVYHTDEPFGESYAATLRNAYPNIVGQDPFQITQTDFRNGVAKLAASGAERVVIIGFGIGEKNLLREMAERGALIPPLGSEVFFYATGDLPGMAAQPGMNAFFSQSVFLGPTLLNAILSPEGDPFIAYYRGKHGGSDPQLFGVFGADALVLLQRALAETGGDADPTRLRDALRDSGELKVFSGRATLLPSLELEYSLDFFGLTTEGRAKPMIKEGDNQ